MKTFFLAVCIGIGFAGLVVAEEIGVANEIRALLQKYNPDKEEEIMALDLVPGRVTGELQSIDRYAHWLPSARRSGFISEPDTAGVGAELIFKQQQWWLIPWQGGALFDQGISQRFHLIAVEGKPVSDFNRTQLVKVLTGAPNTVVCMELKIGGQAEEVCVLRRVLSKPSVELVGDGYIRIRDFRMHETRTTLQLFVSQMYSAQEDDAKQLVIDLRESQGGNLHEALDSASLFLNPNQLLAVLKQANGKSESIRAPSSLPSFQMPLVLLLGEDTASAAEVFAGVLLTAERASSKGSKTYGKCVSQTEALLSDGTILRLTNLQVFFPDGSTCQDKGLFVSTAVGSEN